MTDYTTQNTLNALPFVNGPRLWRALERMAQIGATPMGGVCRVALSALDGEYRDLFVRWAKDATAKSAWIVSETFFSRRAGRDADAAPVVTGSCRFAANRR